MFRCDIDEAELVFGQGARERALRAKETQLQEIQTKRHSAEQAARNASRLVDNIDQVQALHINEIVTDMLALYRASQQLEKQLAALDLSDFEALEQELNDVTRQHDDIKGELNQAQTEMGALQSKRDNHAAKAKQIADQQESQQA